MIATTSFMVGPSVSSSDCHVPACGFPQIWHLFGQMAQKSCKRERKHRDLCPPGPVQGAPSSVRMESFLAPITIVWRAVCSAVLGEIHVQPILVLCIQWSAAGPLSRSAIPRPDRARTGHSADAGLV